MLQIKRSVIPVVLAVASVSGSLNAQTVRFNTSLGGIDVVLTPAVTPQTVANFMTYVTSGEYNNNIFYHSLNSVNYTSAVYYLIEGGGFIVKNHLPYQFAPNDTIPNEFKASNVRGTLAMALSNSDINSATDQWYFNTSDNSGTLNSGSFTVFGKVANNPSLAVMDAINALPTFTLNAISYFPLLNYTAGHTVSDANYVYVNSIAQLAPAFTGVANAATALDNTATGISPGEIITIYGANLGPTTLTTLKLDAAGSRVVNSLEGTQVLFNDIAGPMVFTTDGQVAVVVPYGIAGQSTVTVAVSYLGLQTSSAQFKVVAANPGIFTLSQTGKGDAAIERPSDLTVISASNPAAPGDVLELYGDGYGIASPSLADGALVTGALPIPVATMTLLIDGQTVPTLYAGGAGAEVNGVMQVNFIVPAGLAPGSHKIQVKVGSAISPDGVTLQTK